jgi:hypothetical protein
LFGAESAVPPRGPSRTSLYWRRKLARAAAAALIIGSKQGQDARRDSAGTPQAHLRPFVPTRAEATDLH